MLLLNFGGGSGDAGGVRACAYVCVCACVCDSIFYGFSSVSFLCIKYTVVLEIILLFTICANLTPNPEFPCLPVTLH